MDLFDKRAIFDEVLAKVVDQGAPSLNDNDSCMYRSPDGKKCAAGHLINDEFYNETFEYVTCEFQSVVEALEKSLNLKLTELDKVFIRDLQFAHDTSDRDDFVTSYKARMEGVKKKWKL